MAEFNQQGYKTAFKATSLFGGVQFICIIIKILQSKLIAVWLGSVGFGIMSLFNATTSLIASLANLGLQSSAVRDIAAADKEQDIHLVSQIVKAINRWVVGTGLLGALITIALSPWLSRWVFDCDTYTLAFVFLSSVVLLTGIYNEYYAIMQGTRHLKLLAKANIFSALAGFVCSVPMYYFFREAGIVWALILTAISTTFISFLYVRKIKLVTVRQSYKESYRLGLNTVKLGIMMSLSSISALLVQFIVKTFITHQSGLSEAGFYQAALAINDNYLGLVFIAMAKDYFPRLSQSKDNNQLVKAQVNEQAEIALLILSPMIIGMIVFLPFVIELLYSSEFLPLITMTKWLLVGAFVKAASWAISFIFLAKGDGKTYLFNELGVKCITLPSYLLGYYFFQLNGTGYAYLLNYAVYFLWLAIVAYRKYKVSYNREFWKILLISLLFTIFYSTTESLYNPTTRYVIGILMILIISAFSFIELKRRLISHKS